MSYYLTYSAFFITLLSISYSLHLINRNLKEMHTTLNYIAGIEQEDEDEIAQEIEKRDKEFDERIAKIKDELLFYTPVNHTPTQADILNPNVYNLPHDEIYSRETDVEISI